MGSVGSCHADFVFSKPVSSSQPRHRLASQLFGDGNYTCSVADWTATMIGPMKMPDGKVIQPTHKTAKLEFCTVATWKNSEITEERLFYDVVGMMKQLGLT